MKINQKRELVDPIVTIYHPRDAKPIAKHAEPRSPERFFEWHRDFTAFGQWVKNALGLGELGKPGLHVGPSRRLVFPRRVVRGHDDPVADPQ